LHTDDISIQLLNFTFARMKIIAINIILFFGLLISTYGQINLEWIDTTTQADYTPMFYFTNRPAVISDSGEVDFLDKYQYGTDTLTFGTYHAEVDSFSIKFRASHAGHLFYDVPREENFLYKVYHDLIVKK